MYYIPGLNDQQKTQKQPSTPSTEQQQPQNQSQQLPQQLTQQQLQQPQQLQQTQPQKHKPKTSKHGITIRKILITSFKYFYKNIFNFMSIFPLDPTKPCTTCQYVGTTLLENNLHRGKFYLRKEKDSTGKNVVQ
jgi:hypothetical protein